MRQPSVYTDAVNETTAGDMLAELDRAVLHAKRLRPVDAVDRIYLRGGIDFLHNFRMLMRSPKKKWEGVHG